MCPDGWVRVTTFLLARFFATYAYNVGFQFTVEVRTTCTVLCCTVLHCNVLYCTVLYCTVL